MIYGVSYANTHTPHTRHRQHNHRHQTRNAKATNRQGGVAAHVTTARVRAAVAPVLSLSALPPPVFIAGCVCNDYSSCARSCPGLPAVPSAASGLPEAFVESAAGFSRWLLLSLMFMRRIAIFNGFCVLVNRSPRTSARRAVFSSTRYCDKTLITVREHNHCTVE